MLREPNQDKVITFYQVFGHDLGDNYEYPAGTCIITYDNVSYEAKFDALWCHVSVLSANVLGVILSGTISFISESPILTKNNLDQELIVKLNLYSMYKNARYITDGGASNLLLNCFSGEIASSLRIYGSALTGWWGDRTLNGNVQTNIDTAETIVVLDNTRNDKNELVVTLDTVEPLGIAEDTRYYATLDQNAQLKLKTCRIRINTLFNFSGIQFTNKYLNSIEKKLKYHTTFLFNNFVNKEVNMLC